MGVVLAKVISFPRWSGKLPGESQCSRGVCLREGGVCVCVSVYLSVCLCILRGGSPAGGWGAALRLLAQKANIAFSHTRGPVFCVRRPTVVTGRNFLCFPLPGVNESGGGHAAADEGLSHFWAICTGPVVI